MGDVFPGGRGRLRLVREDAGPRPVLGGAAGAGAAADVDAPTRRRDDGGRGRGRRAEDGRGAARRGDRGHAGRQVDEAPVAALGRGEVDDGDRVPVRRLPGPAVPVLHPRRGRGGARRPQPRPLPGAPAPLQRARAVHRRSPTRSARWRPPTGCTASRWAATASRRSSRAACPPSRPPRTARSRAAARPPEPPSAAIVARRVPRDWNDLFITGDESASGGAGAGSGERGRRARDARRVLPASAREPLQDAPGADHARSRPPCSRRSTSSTWERLEEALIMADVGASDDRRGRRPSSSRRPPRGASRAGRRCSERLIELLAETARTGDDRIDIRPAPDGDPRRRRQRHGQDDDDRQARLAPAARARPQRAARRRGHLPGRGHRAARGLGRARRLRDRHRARGLRPRRGRLRGRGAGPRARPSTS